MIRRREFIAGLGGAAVAWPLAAWAQGERMRRIGVLLGSTAPDRPDFAGFLQALQQLGWSEGHNLRIDYRWGRGNAADTRKYVQELVALAPDVLLLSGASSLTPLLQATRTLPIVFTSVADPVGAGFVESMSRPGGNATGFIQFEYSLSGKWLELLKQVAPGVTRAAVLRDPAQTAGVGQFAVIQSVASTVGIEVVPVNVRDADEIERAATAFARTAGGGLVVTASALTLVHLDRIVALAASCGCPRSIRGGSMLNPAAWSPTGSMWSTRSGARPVTWTASSRVRSRPSYRSRTRPSTTWSSTSRLPKHSVSPCPTRCSRAPTR